MEYGSESLSFRVLSGDVRLLSQVIEKYNSSHNTQIEVTGHEELDGVMFADLKATNIKPHEIFDLGMSFGMTVQHTRQKGEIEW